MSIKDTNNVFKNLFFSQKKNNNFSQNTKQLQSIPEIDLDFFKKNKLFINNINNDINYDVLEDSNNNDVLEDTNDKFSFQMKQQLATNILNNNDNNNVLEDTNDKFSFQMKQQLSTNILNNNDNDNNILEDTNVLEDANELEDTNDKFSFQMKQQLATNILNLERFEMIQIFYIIKNRKEKFTKNQNGILFDLLKFKNSTIKNLDNFIHMTSKYRKCKINES